MASISALSLKLDTLLKRIHSTFTGKLDVDAQAADSALLEGKTAAEVRADVISTDLATVNGLSGEFPMFHQNGVPMALKPTSLLRRIRLASDTAAIDNLKNTSVSFATIFNEWTRISHAGGLASPAVPAELTAWNYDSVNDRITCNANTTSMVGFVSKDRFEEYVFETIVKSTDADNDVIGIVLAYKKIGDIEHTLTVLLDTGGLDPNSIVLGTVGVPKVTVAYNYPRANGGTEFIYQQPMGFAKQDWNGADFAAGLKILAKRKSDKTFEVTVTKADGSPLPTPIYWSAPIPDMFLTPCPIGYAAHSQASSTWENLQLPVSKEDIVDTRDTTVWKYVNNVWVNAGQYAVSEAALQRGLFYKDSVGFHSFYLDLDGEMLKMGSPGTLN